MIGVVYDVLWAHVTESLNEDTMHQLLCIHANYDTAKGSLQTNGFCLSKNQPEDGEIWIRVVDGAEEKVLLNIHPVHTYTAEI